MAPEILSDSQQGPEEFTRCLSNILHLFSDAALANAGMHPSGTPENSFFLSVASTLEECAADLLGYSDARQVN